MRLSLFIEQSLFNNVYHADKNDSFVMKESCDTSQAYPAIVVIATQTPSGYRVKQ